MKTIAMCAALLAGTFFYSPATAQVGAGWPGGFAGHLEPVELVWGIVASGQPLHRGLAVDFKLTLIEDGRMFVEEEAMKGLPFDQTREEMQANNTSAVIDMPYNFSETAQNDPAGFEDFVNGVASQLERLRASPEPELAAEATCSGLLPGAEWTARATDASCDQMLEVTYRCTVTEVNGHSRGTWLQSESEERAVTSDLSSYCG